MPEARILVVGAGSAGSRHARNLTALGARVVVSDTMPNGLRGYDGIVIATPTACHREHALEALTTSAAVMVEKPLAGSSENLEELVSAGRSRLTVGYNLRFHRPVARTRDLLPAAGRVAAVRFWFGSYLPDWRPAVDYRSTYSAQAPLGGGILGDASHEIDLLVWMFGPEWTCAGAVMGHRSALEIDVEDIAVALLRSADGLPALISLDAVSRRYRRGIEVVGEGATVRLDWDERTITTESADGVRVEAAEDPVDASYLAEAAAFLDQVAGRTGPAIPADEAAVTVRLCDDIRRAAAWL